MVSEAFPPTSHTIEEVPERAGSESLRGIGGGGGSRLSFPPLLELVGKFCLELLGDFLSVCFGQEHVGTDGVRYLKLADGCVLKLAAATLLLSFGLASD